MIRLDFLQMTMRNYVLYGLFVLCFTYIFYILFDHIVRGDTAYSIPKIVSFEKFEIADNRPERITKICKTLNMDAVQNKTPVVLSVYHFYNRSNICTCHVPKAASTSIGRALLISEYPEKADIFRSMPAYSVHTRKEVLNVTRKRCFKNSATSFLVTRDPYRRLYSAYIDKVYLQKFHKYALVLDAMFNKGVPRQKLNEMINNNDEHLNKLFCGLNNVSFEQFLQAVTTAQNIDSHFAPVSLMCDPCTNRYDVILKQESLSDDVKNLFEEIYGRNYSAEEVPALTDYTGESGIESQITSYYTNWHIWLKKQKCMVDTNFYNAINRRLWDALKLLGYIDENLEFKNELFRRPNMAKLAIKSPETILYEFKINKIPYLDSVSRRRQRDKYLTQAYRNVDNTVIKNIQKLFRLDFIFFGYDLVLPT